VLVLSPIVDRAIRADSGLTRCARYRLAHDEGRLDALKTSLLHRLRPDVQLGADEGDEAFDRHLLLAARVHRAARLNQRGTREGDGWRQFIEAYFPSGRNGRADADRLWKKWRVGLLKDYVPLDGVAVTHGQPEAHWQRDSQGAFVVNLESMWDDFEYAVDQFIAVIAADKKQAAVVRRRWLSRTWTVRPFQLLPQMIGSKHGSRVSYLLPVGSVSASDLSRSRP
jgi:hypothetical protein